MTVQQILLECVSDRDIIRHSARVADLCLQLAGRFRGEIINRRLLWDAAWLHDVARIKIPWDDEHHKPKKVRAKIKRYVRASYMDDLTKIIKRHRKKFDPEEYKLESAILRVCDKLDKLNKALEKKTAVKADEKRIEAIESCIKSFEKFSSSGALKDDQIEILRTFSAEYIVDHFMWLARRRS